MTRKHLTLVAILVAIPLALVACGDDDEDETSADGEATIEATTADETTTDEEATGGGGGGETIAISETEFALDPSDPTAPAGPVTIEVTNDGGTLHNLEVEGNGVEEITADLEPGDSDTLDLDLDAGAYTLYCAIGDHQAQGMEGELTVE